MSARVAIVDYGMGNLYSVLRACQSVGLDAHLTSSRAEVEESAGVILPGVGAFPDGMRELSERGLVEPLRRIAGSHKPFLGICLGMQFMMVESFEFGRTAGLGLIDGAVVRFEGPRDGDDALKVPEVGWNTIAPTPTGAGWSGTPLEGLAPGTAFYFVHSFYAVPRDPKVIASVTHYGQIEYCSSIAKDNLFGCQYHPERSGERGLAVYRNFANLVLRSR